MTWLQALALAIVEGITEFLPVSSTGHMIIASALMGIQHSPFTRVFEVSIQSGAILSVVVLYFRRFLQSWSFYARLFVAFLPTAILGLLLKRHIDTLLESVEVVAVMLLLGGVLLLFVDRWFARSATTGATEPSYLQGAFIGFVQAISMIPGVSRSAASIVGGMSQGLTRKAAAEFSFLLAVPTMAAATAKSLYDDRHLLEADKIGLLLFGSAVAFVVAMLAIRGFVGFLTRHGFVVFGWYRIVVGTLLLVLLYGLGWDLRVI
jgi:undecaprenyl-diphosphatase